MPLSAVLQGEFLLTFFFIFVTIKPKEGVLIETVHQAKGLEYDNVIVIDTVIRNMEDLNIAYVALTRARDNMLIINWSGLEEMWLQDRSKPKGFGWAL